MAGYTPNPEKVPEMQILGINERCEMEMLPLPADRGTQPGRGSMPKVYAEKKEKGGRGTCLTRKRGR